MPPTSELATDRGQDRGRSIAGSVTPTPTDEELAAIVAAIEVTRPVVVVADTAPSGPPPWRFSGRWWRRPIAARRERPW